MLELLKALFAESAAIATELGVDFPVPLDRRLQAGIAVGDHETSMLQDLEAGKRLEIDCMIGESLNSVISSASRCPTRALFTRAPNYSTFSDLRQSGLHQHFDLAIWAGAHDVKTSSPALPPLVASKSRSAKLSIVSLNASL
jgi:hypothetical protein